MNAWTSIWMAESYDLEPLRSGRGELTPLEEAEIGDVDGLSILHLQCHFGRDTLTLAQRSATVVGLDFSPRAIAVALGWRLNSAWATRRGSLRRLHPLGETITALLTAGLTLRWLHEHDADATAAWIRQGCERSQCRCSFLLLAR
jgi:trans-aconitate methyltransferase